MTRFAALAAMAVASFSATCASNAVAADSGVAIGPIAIGETRADVEKNLGGSAPVCHVNTDDDTSTQRCYTDPEGDLLTVTFSHIYEPETVAAVWLSQKIAKGGKPNVKTALHFGTWKWLGRPAFADALPATPPGWKINGTGAKYISFAKGGYGADKKFEAATGWRVTIGEE